MPNLYNYRLFISHAWKYGEKYERAIRFLNDANNFKYSNHSVPVSRAFPNMSITQLKEELKQQIRGVDAVIIIGGMYAAHSSWIKFEIDYAVQLGKPILGIRPWGAAYMPTVVKNAIEQTPARSEIVNWNSDSIVSAIRRIVP